MFSVANWHLSHSHVMQFEWPPWDLNCVVIHAIVSNCISIFDYWIHSYSCNSYLQCVSCQISCTIDSEPSMSCSLIPDYCDSIFTHLFMVGYIKLFFTFHWSLISSMNHKPPKFHIIVHHPNKETFQRGPKLVHFHISTLLSRVSWLHF